MKAPLIRKLKMYNTVLSLLNRWIILWNQLLAFTENHAQLTKYIDDIYEKDKAIKSSIVKSREKKQRFTEMYDSSLIVGGAGASYAHKINDPVLAMHFNFTLSSLKKGNEEDICKRCQIIATAAEPIMEHLADHNLKQEDLTKLTNAISLAKKLISAPHVAIKNHKSMVSEMEQLFADCDEFLKGQLDKDVITFKKSQPDFCLEYSVAREIGGWSRGKKEKTEGNGEKE